MSEYSTRIFKEIHLVIQKDKDLKEAINFFVEIQLGFVVNLSRLLRLSNSSYSSYIRYAISNVRTGKNIGCAVVKVDVLGNFLVYFSTPNGSYFKKKLGMYKRKSKGGQHGSS